MLIAPKAFSIGYYFGIWLRIEIGIFLFWCSRLEFWKFEFGLRIRISFSNVGLEISFRPWEWSEHNFQANIWKFGWVVRHESEAHPPCADMGSWAVRAWFVEAHPPCANMISYALRGWFVRHESDAHPPCADTAPCARFMKWCHI